MARPIPEELIDQVRTSVNIADIIGRTVQLSKSGKNLFGICPFHEEKTPSFSVSEDKQIFHCFSCGRGGNVFKFLMELNGISFPEAVQEVAEVANIQLDQQYTVSRQTTKYSNGQQELIKVHQQAAELFHHILTNTKLGEDALLYLKDRGITDQDIADFNLGYAPDEEILTSFMQEHQVSFDILGKTGLFNLVDNNILKDRFKNRIMFPIKNANGDVVAFSGRLLVSREGAPKYLNSPETAIFNKSTTIYNFSDAKPAIAQSNQVILLEGFMDVIATHRVGIKNGVASMGTSLTEQQVQMLNRVAKEIIISYDGDTAGQNAIARAIDLIQTTSSATIKVISIPNNQDPDEYVKQYGNQRLIDLFQASGETGMAFFMRFNRRDLNLNNENDQLEYIQSILKRLATLNSQLEQDLYLNQLSEMFSIDKGDLKIQLNRMMGDQSSSTIHKNNSVNSQPVSIGRQNVAKQIDKVTLAQQRLLNRALNFHNVWLRLQGEPNFAFPTENYQTIYMLADGYFDQHVEFNPASFMDYLRDDDLQSIIAELETEIIATEPTKQEIDDYINIVMNVAPLNVQIGRLQKNLAEAVKFGNTNLAEELTEQLIGLYRQQQTI